MTRLDFGRVDVLVHLARTPTGGALISAARLGAGGRRPTAWRRLGQMTAAAVTGTTPGESRSDLAEALGPLIHGLERRVLRQRSRSPAGNTLGRIVLSIDDPALRRVAWEPRIASLLGPWGVVVVRDAGVRWHGQDAPFSLPLRILQIRQPGGPHRLGSVTRAFGEPSNPDWEESVNVEEVSLDDIPAFRTEPGWPAAHVIHVSSLPPVPDDLVSSTARADVPGTVGWFYRLVETWQTRLLILDCGSAAEAENGRFIAHALADRGGPATLVTEGEGEAGFDTLYARLIHDFPLDDAAQRLTPAPTLVAGMGREEALRVSSVAVGLMSLATELGDVVRTGSFGGRPDAAQVVRLFEPGNHASLIPTRDWARAAARSVRTSLDRQIGSRWADLEYQFHEGGGLIPSAHAVRTLRLEAGVTGPAERPTGHGGARFVNTTLLGSDVGGTQTRIGQARSVWSGRPIQLAVQIAERDRRNRVIGAAGVLEEVFAWTPGMDGVWVEVAVTGIDFDVVGHPVQEIWLPRTGPSDEAVFTIVPRASPVAVLRLCVYYRNNVVQSLRLAAIVRDPPRRRTVGSARERTVALARALDVEPALVTEGGWATRLEYADAASADHIDSAPPRALSVVANDLGGRSIITLKGDDVFVTTDADLPTYVAQVRNALDPKPDSIVYPFSPAAPDREESFRHAIRAMAARGWDLYSTVVPQVGRQIVHDALEANDEAIHVASIVVEKVIPWAAVYDRPFDEGAVDDAGQPAAWDVCVAGLPAADGQLPTAHCGESPACVLHTDAVARRQQRGERPLTSSTVVCPLRFWGFRHVIELPVQQVDAEGRVREMARAIAVEPPPNVCVAYNPDTQCGAKHVEEVMALAVERGGSSSRSPVSARNAVLAALGEADLDVVYVYCHAVGDRQAGPFPPYLEFGPGQAVTPSQLTAVTWDHHPLVFLNACRTGAFSPDALSAFVRRFVQDGQAGAVIATEVSVWEDLAVRFGKRFMRSFLAGVPAGEAVRQARLALLADRDPLGLAYTLYGPADLALTNLLAGAGPHPGGILTVR